MPGQLNQMDTACVPVACPILGIPSVCPSHQLTKTAPAFWGKMSHSQAVVAEVDLLTVGGTVPRRPLWTVLPLPNTVRQVVLRIDRSVLMLSSMVTNDCLLLLSI